ncbi:Protein of unknown function DM4/12 [Trinorchestia longiramus]|nr:Protein of unknown function DM4/12 [Trinorchestia longiramus]
MTGQVFLFFFLLIVYVNLVRSLTDDSNITEPKIFSVAPDDIKDPSERFFQSAFQIGTGSTGQASSTSVTIGNAGYVVLGAYLLVPLIIGLALLFYLIGGHGDPYGGSGGGGYAVESYGPSGSTYGNYARMNRTLLALALLAALCAGSQAIKLDDNLLTDDFDEDPADSRFIISGGNDTSVTIGYGTFILGAATVLGLLSLLCLALIWAAGAHDDQSGYGQSGYSDYGSGYARKSLYSSKQKRLKYREVRDNTVSSAGFSEPPLTMPLFVSALQCVRAFTESFTMNRMLLQVVGVLLTTSCVFAYEFMPYPGSVNEDRAVGNAPSYTDAEGRIFFVNANASTGTFVTFNTTLLLFSAGILLWGIAGGLGLYYLLTASHLHSGGSGYDSGYDSGYGSSGYGRKRRGSFDPYAIDWEKFSILDWINIGEEAWRKFDPADLDCQKRLICEVHQNTSRFGAAASKMVDLFSYLQYAEVLSIPEKFKALIDEYLDAADRGRNLQKECGEIYSSCEFSVKKMVDKYNHNEI